jgi:hypothetical protein
MDAVRLPQTRQCVFFPPRGRNKHEGFIISSAYNVILACGDFEGVPECSGRVEFVEEGVREGVDWLARRCERTGVSTR